MTFYFFLLPRDSSIALGRHAWSFCYELIKLSCVQDKFERRGTRHSLVVNTVMVCK